MAKVSAWRNRVHSIIDDVGERSEEVTKTRIFPRISENEEFIPSSQAMESVNKIEELVLQLHTHLDNDFSVEQKELLGDKMVEILSLMHSAIAKILPNGENLPYSKLWHRLWFLVQK